MKNRLVRSIVGAAVFLFTLAGCGFAQPQEQSLREEIEALKAGQQAIQKELADIKTLLQPRRPQAANVRDVVFDLGDNPTRGASTAKLTLVEFSDYQ